jgi:hypothetical protein
MLQQALLPWEQEFASRDANRLVSCEWGQQIFKPGATGHDIWINQDGRFA